MYGQETKTVIFLTRWKNYNPGEGAGFAPGLAAQLVDSGIAKYRPEPTPEPSISPPAVPPVRPPVVSAKKPAKVLVKKQ